MPAAFMWSFTAAMGTSRRWKMPAASAAAARVSRNTSEKCSGAPAPLEAMTGMVTASVVDLLGEGGEGGTCQRKQGATGHS